LRYKDFKRTIENKKEVYEKLLISDMIPDDIINEKKSTLESLKKRRQELNIKDNDRYNKLKIILKDADINYLNSLYYDELKVGMEEIINKPCELSFLIQEEKELDRWIKKNPCKEFIISEKLDGVSGMFIQTNGKRKLYTRGDGIIGADISYLIQYIANIPDFDEDIAIRGELIIKNPNCAGNHHIKHQIKLYK
jgi:ATP-dependent DNA ligase